MTTENVSETLPTVDNERAIVEAVKRMSNDEYYELVSKLPSLREVAQLPKQKSLEECVNRELVLWGLREMITQYGEGFVMVLTDVAWPEPFIVPSTSTVFNQHLYYISNETLPVRIKVKSKPAVNGNYYYLD